jgi:hypothetical protein
VAFVAIVSQYGFLLRQTNQEERSTFAAFEAEASSTDSSIDYM